MCVAGPRVSLEQQFKRKVLNTDGSESGEFVINEEFIASLDYIVACSPWAGIQESQFRQTARQGKRERRKALKMMMMMVKTKAVRIANENPKAGPMAKLPKHYRKQLVRENWRLPRPPKDLRSLIRSCRAKKPSKQGGER